jgi:riboflavin biosynthesis pyrimidine reductase
MRLAEAAAKTGDPFAPLRAASKDRPFVVAQIGQSLDGRIATVSGESRDISGPAALDHLHRLRAHVDAVVVGAGTVVADDPQLNVRRIAGRNPARVAIDPSGRLSDSGKWLNDDGARRILISAAPAAASTSVERIELPSRNGRIAPQAIVAALFARGLRWRASSRRAASTGFTFSSRRSLSARAARGSNSRPFRRSRRRYART